MNILVLNSNDSSYSFNYRGFYAYTLNFLIFVGGKFLYLATLILIPPANHFFSIFKYQLEIISLIFLMYIGIKLKPV